MSQLVKGPFTVEYGDVVLEDIEEISVDYSIDSTDVSTVQGSTYTVKQSQKASASLTFLANDVPTLSAILPQHFVANGGTMSTGETVTDSDGAIDVLASDTTTTKHGLIITSSGGVSAQVARIPECRTEVEEVTFEDQLRRIVVTFIGEPAGDQATIQFFKSGALGAIS